MQPLVIFGASGHARVIADAAKLSNRFTVLGFISPDRVRGEYISGLPVLGDDRCFPEVLAHTPNVRGIVGIGDNRLRATLVASIKAACPSFEFASVIHPKTVIAPDVQIGEGVFVAASATINCGSSIGDHAVVNTGACIDHDCVIACGAFVGPRAALAGGVHLGQTGFVGIGASIAPGVKIGEAAVVGAGATVIRSVPPASTVVGVPARVIRGPESAPS